MTRFSPIALLLGGLSLGFSVGACSSDETEEGTGDGDASGDSGDGDTPGESGETTEVVNPLTDPAEGPPAGAEGEGCDVPVEATVEDTSSPTTVVGDGSPSSCTGQGVVDAVAQGGVITFDCGPDPITITMSEAAKVVNDAAEEVVIDGGGLVTLSGAGSTRILYMNTCDENQVWTTSHCNDQDHPRLTVQNITFVDGNSESEEEYDGGGAIWIRGGRFKAVNTRFFNNVCAPTGPDVGGGAIRVFDQYQDQPVYVVNSTFGGEDGLGNICSNGGALSSIGVSWSIFNSHFSHNEAIGEGANPAQSGTPGGGSGGAIYNDGNEMTLSICGSVLESNSVNEHGAAIFFVSNNHTGDIRLEDVSIQDSCEGSWYPLYDGISMHDDTSVEAIDSDINECP